MNTVVIHTLSEADLGKIQMFCGHSPTYRDGYESKMRWLRDRLSQGMRYRLLTVNGRNAGMIEYIPAEAAWRGVEAPGYFFIHCFWVVGRNRGHGYGRELLEACLEDAKSSKGVAVLTSRTHWLPTRKIFLKNGFTVFDKNPPFELLAIQFDPDAPAPRLVQRKPFIPPGLVLFHSAQCPYMQNMPVIVRQVGEQMNIPTQIVHLDNARQAQDSPCLYGVQSIYYNGKLVDYRPTGTKKLVTVLEAMNSAPKLEVE